jgi:hypothetical protein
MNDKSEKILIIGEAQRSRPDTPLPRSLERGMNDKSEKILIIGEAQRSRPDTPQLAAGRVHSKTFLRFSLSILCFPQIRRNIS